MAEWKVSRDGAEFVAPDLPTLQHWAKLGRVMPTDYVFHPLLGRWSYASEIRELVGLLPSPAVNRQASRSSCGLAIALFLFAFLLGMIGASESLGVLLGAGAVLFALIAGVLYVLGR